MKKEYDFSKLKEVKNPYAGKKKAVGINLSPSVVDYFKGVAEETGLPYQKLIDLYLLDCAKKRKEVDDEVGGIRGMQKEWMLEGPHQVSIRSPSTFLKCSSRVAKGKLCCIADAAIQMSFSGIGRPFKRKRSLI